MSFGLISGFPLPIRQGRGTDLGIVVLLLFFQQLLYIHTHTHIYIYIYDLKYQTVIMIVFIRKEYNMDQMIGFIFHNQRKVLVTIVYLKRT